MIDEKIIVQIKPLFKRFWWVGLAVPALIIVVIFIGTLGKEKIGPAQNSSIPKVSSQSANKQVSSNLPSCGKKMDFFTASPIKSQDYGALIPLGNLNPTGHVFPTDHIYLFSKNTPDNGQASEALAKPLYSPGDMWITDVST